MTPIKLLYRRLKKRSPMKLKGKIARENVYAVKSLDNSKIDDSVKDAIEAHSQQEEPQKIEEDQLIKIDEVCKILQVSKVTVHSWKKAGKIPFHRISNKVYFKKSEILEALQKIERKVWS